MSSTMWCSPVSRSPDAFETQVHAAVEGELLEHVVVETESGVHVDPTLAGDPQTDVQQRLGRGATTPERAFGAASPVRTERNASSRTLSSNSSFTLTRRPPS